MKAAGSNFSVPLKKGHPLSLEIIQNVNYLEWSEEKVKFSWFDINRQATYKQCPHLQTKAMHPSRKFPVILSGDYFLESSSMVDKN